MKVVEDKWKSSKDGKTWTHEVKVIKQDWQTTEKVEYPRNQSPRIVEIEHKKT